MTSNCCGQPLKSKVQMSVYAVFYFFTIFDWAYHSLLWFSSCFPGCPSSVSFVGPSSTPQTLIQGASRAQTSNCPPFSLYSLPKWSHLDPMALNMPPMQWFLEVQFLSRLPPLTRLCDPKASVPSRRGVLNLTCPKMTNTSSEKSALLEPSPSLVIATSPLQLVRTKKGHHRLFSSPHTPYPIH